MILHDPVMIGSRLVATVEVSGAMIGIEYSGQPGDGAGPDPDRLHRLGRAGLFEPRLLYRARRDPAAPGQDFPA